MFLILRTAKVIGNSVPSGGEPEKISVFLCLIAVIPTKQDNFSVVNAKIALKSRVLG